VAMRLHGVALLLAERGELDEAEAIQEEANAIDRENPEPQSTVWGRQIDGLIALGRGRMDDALDFLAVGAREARERSDWEAGLLLELTRLLASAARPAEAEPWRDELRRMSSGRPLVEIHVAWADALLAPKDEASVAALERVVDALAGADRPVEHARALIDLALAYSRQGRPAAETLEQARRILEETGARLFLVEVDAAARQITVAQAVGSGADRESRGP